MGEHKLKRYKFQGSALGIGTLSAEKEVTMKEAAELVEGGGIIVEHKDLKPDKETKDMEAESVRKSVKATRSSVGLTKQDAPPQDAKEPVPR